jgi:hypothetical protein
MKTKAGRNSRDLHFLICFEVLMMDGTKHTAIHENYNKERYRSVFARVKTYCGGFGVNIPASAYGWFDGKIFAGDSTKMREVIKNNPFATVLFPDAEIAEIHLKITRIA